MKYGDLNLGQMEAIVNKLGGMDGVRRFLSGETVIKAVEPSFRHDKCKDGWTLSENVSRRLTSVKIDGVSFLKETETYINGEEMVRRARTEFNANYGQEDAEYLLEHQDKIPAKLREFYLVFPGTIWQDSGGLRGVPSLGWRGGQWYLRFFWLGSDWDSGLRLVVPSK